MKTYSQSEMLAFREIHYKIQRKAIVNELVRHRARQLFDEEFQKQSEAEKQILKKDAVEQIKRGDWQFKGLILWDSIIEKLIQTKGRLTRDFFLILTCLYEQECLSSQSQERLVKFIKCQKILKLKSDNLIFEAIELLMILGYKFIDEMFVIEMVLRLINHNNTYYILSQILKEDDLIFTSMTEEMRFFINLIYEQAERKHQDRIIQIILKQRPQLVDQDRSLFGLPLNQDESKGNQGKD